MKNIPEPNEKLKKAFKDFHKQETLEEAAEKWLNKDGFNIYNHYDTRPSFIAGAKWQQERSYSEEEVKPLLNAIKYFIDRVENGTIRSKTTYNMYKEVLSQFKNK